MVVKQDKGLPLKAFLCQLLPARESVRICPTFLLYPTEKLFCKLDHSLWKCIQQFISMLIAIKTMLIACFNSSIERHEGANLICELLGSL